MGPRRSLLVENKQNRTLPDPCRFGVIRHNKAQSIGAGPVIAGGMLFCELGQCRVAGNVLLAFAPAITPASRLIWRMSSNQPSPPSFRYWLHSEVQ